MPEELVEAVFLGSLEVVSLKHQAGGEKTRLRDGVWKKGAA